MTRSVLDSIIFLSCEGTEEMMLTQFAGLVGRVRV